MLRSSEFTGLLGVVQDGAVLAMLGASRLRVAARRARFARSLDDACASRVGGR
ncbi:MAG: hypothetical protein KF718_14610 [Polyangiaceae bacterium]|nr:hypothetical protein [Polyangiaceae bacterium]